jgi:hypothetical protein
MLKEELQSRARRREELRDLLVSCGFETPSGIGINAVLSQCQDVDLAFTALTMSPRPIWVQELVGPLSVSSA